MARNYKQGKFTPKNPKKYRGVVDNICYRSSWELRVFKYMDDNPMVLEWASEECVIPYKSPVDGKFHRYFPDIWCIMKDVTGRSKTYLIEIKPYKESVEPKVKKRITKQYVTEVCTYAVNQAKWKAARLYCADRGWEWKVLTEHELGL